MGVYAASRLGLYSLALLILHLAPRGDIYIYMDEAKQALADKLVYRDFITPHAPLDPYLLSSMLRLPQLSPLTIIFFAVLFDIATMFVWLKAAELFQPHNASPRSTFGSGSTPQALLPSRLTGR